jgi:hypothetical protein
MRAILPVLLALLLGASCGGTDLPSQPSAHKAVRFADITSADALQYVRPADQITRPDLVEQPPRFIFETDGTLCPQACDTEAWDGTTLSCVSIRHVPAEFLTLYVLDPARAGVNGNVHGAYRADSISFRGQPLRTGPCEEPGIPMTCAVLSITTGGRSP